MGKIRIKSKYGTTPNCLLNDKRITLKAKGLYAFIQSKPEDWEFSAEKISGQVKESLDAVRTGLIELEEFGYLERVKFKDEKGFFGIEYILHDKPIFEDPNLENPTLKKATLDLTQNNSKKESTKKDLKKKDIITPSSSFLQNGYSQTQTPPFVDDEQNEFRKKVEEYKTEVATPTYTREQTFEILKNDKLCRETFEKEIFRLNQNRAYARQKKIETLVPENAKRLFEEYVDECCLNAEKDEKFPRKISESKRHLTSFMKIKFQRDQENIINRLNRPY